MLIRTGRRLDVYTFLTPGPGPHLSPSAAVFGTNVGMTQDQIRADGGDRAAWQAGTATRAITPEEPITMAGYGDRLEPSTGVAADLHARALALSDDSGGRVVVVGLDLLGVSHELRAAVADRCEAEFDLPPDALVLNASHTHHGPEYRADEWDVLGVDDDHDRRAREYRERLEAEIVDAVGEALADREPVELRFSRGRCGVGMNRRRPDHEGFTLNAHPDGPVDTDVPVLYATRDDEVRAVMFAYACHPTSRPKRTTFHPDWPGVAAARLEDRYPGATAVFLQGCGADQNPYPKRTEEDTEKHGETVALAVEAAVEARGKRINGPLRTCTETVPLTFADQPGRDELQRRLDDADGTDRYARRFLAELDREGEIRTEFPYQITAVGFGTDLTLVTLGGEVPVGYAHRLKSALAGDVAVAGCSNLGYVYVPTARILREGGYEATWVFLYWRYPVPLDVSNESRITETALALAQRVGATRREPSETAR
jgi:hypothetical protein